MVAESLDHTFLPPGTNGVDDVPALARLLQEGQQRLRRVLEIGIHDRHDIALSVHEAGGNSRLMSEVPRQADHLQPWIDGQALQDFHRPVAASVVHNHQFEVFTPRGTGGAHPAIQFLNAIRLVVCGGYERNHADPPSASGRLATASREVPVLQRPDRVSQRSTQNAASINHRTGYPGSSR